MICKHIDIVFQEVPNEISISFSIAGCQVGCHGCHSAELWYIKGGFKLTDLLYSETLNKYKNYATCVLFLGGEWHEDILIKYLKLAKTLNLKTCLYSGEESISQNIISQLDYLKLGPWIESKGPLSSKSTNQRFIDCRNNKNLNELFLKQI